MDDHYSLTSSIPSKKTAMRILARSSVARQWRRFAKIPILVAVMLVVAASSAGVGESANSNGGGAYGTVNLAQGKGSPAAVTDGDITSIAWNGWNTLDLGSSYGIGKIVVYAMQAQWVRVSTSTDNVNWTERYASSWPINTMVHAPIAVTADGTYSARYVKVLAGNNAGAWVGIAEMEVYEWLPAPPPPPPASAYGTTNLALGRPTVNYYGSIVPSNPPGAAIDGNAGTSWRSNASGAWTTGGYAYGMIRIELAKSYKIGKIVLDPEQVHWYVIATSDSPGGGVYGYPAGSPWVFASYPEFFGTSFTSTEPRTFFFDGAVTAKYIWLQTWTWSGPAPGVSEIEIYEWEGDSTPPPSDTTPPTVTGTPSRPADQNGWYNHAFSVDWQGTDESSGVEFCSAATLYSGPDTEGASVTGSCTDKAGNTGQASFSFRYDATPPVITFTGNNGTYAVDQTVNIDCVVTDATSGVDAASTGCTGANGSAYIFPLGSNTINATAKDHAGNGATASTTFTVDVTFQGLRNLVDRFVSNQGLANSMKQKLSAAENARTSGARAGVIQAFINEAEAQRGKALTGERADVLVRLARVL